MSGFVVFAVLLHDSGSGKYRRLPKANTEDEIEDRFGAKFQILTANFSALKGFRVTILISGDAGRGFLSLIFAH